MSVATESDHCGHACGYHRIVGTLGTSWQSLGQGPALTCTHILLQGAQLGKVIRLVIYTSRLLSTGLCAFPCSQGVVSRLWSGLQLNQANEQNTLHLLTC